ncbi:NusA-like transcription termination signal-binding factor [Candidatus Woesearchaeota archaeon]|nr:NusA-like transcription termination signal-binding factor [Candidatus Woesearchaeota archaeon]
MTKILYDVETIKFSTFFESFTRAKVKDCFKEEDSLIVFVVQQGMLAKAIGKLGINIKKISQKLKKKIKVMEFNPDVCKFVKKSLYPVRDVDVEFKDDSIVYIHCPDTKTKGLVYGRDRERLKSLKSLVKRYFKIEDIIVD